MAGLQVGWVLLPPRRQPVTKPTQKAALRCPNPSLVTTEWLLWKWQNGLYDEVITQLAALQFTPSQFETELAPYADVIVDWVQTHLPGGSSYISNSSTPSVSKVTANTTRQHWRAYERRQRELGHQLLQGQLCLLRSTPQTSLAHHNP
ncbi:hypothetical protein Aduo_016342 [Ancylostoma duodenale]